MALTSLDKDTSNRLLQSLEISSIIRNEVFIDSKKNSAAYGKLELIKSQMALLKKQAMNILEEVQIDAELQKIKCNFKDMFLSLRSILTYQ